MDQRLKYEIRNNKLCRRKHNIKLMNLGHREYFMNLTLKKKDVKVKISE